MVKEDNTDHDLRFGLSFVPSKILSFGINYNYRLDRQWRYEYSTAQTERNLNQRNQHRNMGVNINYTPSSVTSLMMNASRSRQRSGTFDSVNITYSRTI